MEWGVKPYKPHLKKITPNIVKMDCTVCCEKLNASNRKRVVCPFCDFCACRGCTQQCLLSLTTDPHCMSCRKAWSRDVIDDACTAVFRNGPYKQHREMVLFEREKCLMPGTIPAVARVKQLRNYDASIAEQIARVARAQRRLQDLQEERRAIAYGPAPAEAHGPKRVFVRKCPFENCKGFLSTRWKCELCEHTVCPDCNEIKVADTEHACDPGAVETVALLKKDTKPCPNCGTMIFKISGCAQMWCPDCHTAFNWNTMAIERGQIHNPHFYEFQRRTGRANREPGDIPCGGLPDAHELYAMFGYPTHGVHRRYYQPVNLPADAQTTLNIHRLVAHINGVELRIGNGAVDTQPLRVQYMMNEISEDHFKKVLQKNEKAREKSRDVQNIFRMFSDVSADYLRQLVLKTVSLKEFLETMVTLREYTNESFLKVRKRYGCVVPRIPEDWSTNFR